MSLDTFASRVNAKIDDIGRWVDSKPAVRTNRMVGLALALPTWSVLGIARWLTPAEQGYGTHLQLGLGECTMLHLTGYPCPMCGMTTTFTLFAHLRVIDAFFNQPFGIVLFTATLAGAAIGLADLLSARGYWRMALRWIDRRESTIASVLLGGMFLGWVYKVLLLHPELRFW